MLTHKGLESLNLLDIRWKLMTEGSESLPCPSQVKVPGVPGIDVLFH